MKALDRKLLRDLWRAKGQVTTTALVVSGGVAAFLSLVGTYQTLLRSEAVYYERSGFPQVFASLRRAPEIVADDIAAIADVAAIEARVVVDARFEVEGMTQTASGRIVSLPPEGQINLPEVHLDSGRLPDPSQPREALVLRSFAKEHRLSLGDSLSVVAEGQRLVVTICGIAESPEYVLPIGTSGLADPYRFGVLWMPKRTLASAFGLSGAFNDVTLRLRPHADEAEIIAAVDRILEPWGSAGAIARREQLSHRALNGEIKQLRGLALQIPAVFLATEAFLLNIVMGRMVRRQREQLAALKALGYSRRAIRDHYLMFAGVVVVAGSALGIAVGSWWQSWLIGIYAGFFHIPYLVFRMSWELAAAAVGISALAAAVGVIASVRAAVKLPPAEAMRPPTPAAYRPGFLSRLGVAAFFTNVGRMVLRELERRPYRALLSALGIAAGMALLVIGRFQHDVFDWYLDAQLRRGMPADAIVTFSKAVDHGAIGSVAAIDGVLAVEPVRHVPVRVTSRQRSRRIALTAVEPDAALQRVMGIDGSQLGPPPPRGLALGRSLADALGAGIGDVVAMDVLEGEHEHLSLRVSAVVEDMSGNSAYIHAALVQRLLDERPRASAAHVLVDWARFDGIHERLRDIPLVVTTIERQALLDTFAATSASYSRVITLVIVIFSAILAIGTVYNNARVLLSERGRDLATLRVLGFRRGEVANILVGELAAHLLLALPLGVLGGYLMARGIVASLDPELYRMPVVVYPSTYGFAALTVIGSGVVSALFAMRQLEQLDLVGALKARD